MLPLAARQQFLEKGYAILPGALPRSVVEKLRVAALASTLARSRFFYNLPNLEDLLKSSQAKESDPFLDPILAEIDKRKFLLRYYRQLRKQRRDLRRTVRRFINGRTREELSPEDLWKLSELVAQEARKASGRGCTSTIETDAQMLAAINTYRANAWMTNTDLKQILTEDVSLKESLATIAEIVGGVEKPVVFSDAPLLRPAFGNPVTYHCTAPATGTRTNDTHWNRHLCHRTNRNGNASSSPSAAGADGSAPAVTLVILTYTPTQTCLEPFVLENSHRFVREQYLHQVHPRKLFSSFLPSEAHIPFALEQFYFDTSVHGRSLLPPPAASVEGSEEQMLTPGAVIAVDPHLMMAFGPNATWQDEVVYRLNIVSEDARPFLAAPSWIRGWRSLPREVHFASPVVFPPLYK